MIELTSATAFFEEGSAPSRPAKTMVKKTLFQCNTSSDSELSLSATFGKAETESERLLRQLSFKHQHAS